MWVCCAFDLYFGVAVLARVFNWLSVTFTLGLMFNFNFMGLSAELEWLML